MLYQDNTNTGGEKETIDTFAVAILLPSKISYHVIFR